MITKQDLTDSFLHEFSIIKHLATKIPAGAHGHRPTPKQRSTLELLQYLTYSVIASLKHIKTGDQSFYEGADQKSKSVTLENFAEAMDAEAKEVVEIMASFSDKDLDEEISLWGMPKRRKAVLLLNLLKQITGYKMQLFLYAKQSGNHAIGTPNLWAGMDIPQEK